MKQSHKDAPPVPSGILLIIGGAENKGEDQAKKKQTPSDFKRLEILGTFIKLTEKQDPIVEVITSASSEGDGSFEDYKKAFTELKISYIGHIHHNTRDEVTGNEEVITRMEKADAIFFAGGDQLKYTYLYGGTPFLTKLKERYINDKIVVAGTSAGAMAMSTPMIYAGEDNVQELGGMIKVTTGLEFLTDVCVDTHFVHRGRFERMAQVVATNPSVVGMGLEEDTAIIVRNGLDVEVLGTGTIIVIDGLHLSEVTIEDFTSNKPVNIRGLNVHILSDGACYRIPQTNPRHV